MYYGTAFTADIDSVALSYRREHSLHHRRSSPLYPHLLSRETESGVSGPGVLGSASGFISKWKRVYSRERRGVQSRDMKRSRGRGGVIHTSCLPKLESFQRRWRGWCWLTLIDPWLSWCCAVNGQNWSIERVVDCIASRCFILLRFIWLDGFSCSLQSFDCYSLSFNSHFSISSACLHSTRNYSCDEIETRITQDGHLPGCGLFLKLRGRKESRKSKITESKSKQSSICSSLVLLLWVFSLALAKLPSYWVEKSRTHTPFRFAFAFEFNCLHRTLAYLAAHWSCLFVRYS